MTTALNPPLPPLGHSVATDSVPVINSPDRLNVEIGASGTVVLVSCKSLWTALFGDIPLCTFSADDAEQLAFKLAAAAEKSRARAWALSNGATTTTPTQSEFAE